MVSPVVKQTRPESADRIADRRIRRDQRGDAYRLSVVGGLAALSVDALSSVAYGPEAIVLVLIAAGAAAVRWTLPIAAAITMLLLVLVISYRQVIAVHPDGGGAYAVRLVGRAAERAVEYGILCPWLTTRTPGPRSPDSSTWWP